MRESLGISRWGKVTPMAEDNRGFTKLVGTELSSAEEGRAAVSLKAEERHLNPSGTVHGGVISTLIDVSMAEALNNDDQGRRAALHGSDYGQLHLSPLSSSALRPPEL